MIISNGTDPDFVATPAGLAQSLVARLAGMFEVQSGVNGNPTIPLENGQSLPALTTLAAKDSRGNVAMGVALLDFASLWV